MIWDNHLSEPRQGSLGPLSFWEWHSGNGRKGREGGVQGTQAESRGQPGPVPLTAALGDSMLCYIKRRLVPALLPRLLGIEVGPTSPGFLRSRF